MTRHAKLQTLNSIVHRDRKPQEPTQVMSPSSSQETAPTRGRIEALLPTADTPFVERYATLVDLVGFYHELGEALETRLESEMETLTRAEDELRELPQETEAGTALLKGLRGSVLQLQTLVEGLQNELSGHESEVEPDFQGILEGLGTTMAALNQTQRDAFAC